MRLWRISHEPPGFVKTSPKGHHVSRWDKRRIVMKRIGLIFALVALFASAAASAATPSFFGSAGSALDNRPAEVEFRKGVKIENKSLAFLDNSVSNVLPERIKYFGWAGGFDTAQYQTETLPMANIGTIDLYDPRFSDPVWVGEMVKNRAKLIVGWHDTLFERVRPATPEEPWPPFVLRGDYLERIQAAIVGREQVLSALTAFNYVADEPNWTGITRSDFCTGAIAVKNALPFAMTLTSFNHLVTASWFGGQQLCTDAVAYHQYEVRDPRLSSLYQEKLSIVKQFSIGKPLLLVLDGWYAVGRHDVAGLSREDMATVALNYRATCEVEENCIGLVGFIWQSFIEGTGSRDLPQSVKFTYREIGSEITKKCLAPETVVAPETALWFQSCRFMATVHYQSANGLYAGYGVSVSDSGETGQFWFFSAGNREVFMKVLDGRSTNNRWWVFWAGLTDLRLDVSVTDTQTGAVQTYHHGGGRVLGTTDTSAFAD